MEALRELDRETLRRKIREGGIVVIDALGPISYAAAHLPGAVNIPPERVEGLAERRIPSFDTEVVVYCQNPRCKSSVEVANRLVDLGYRSVWHYAGGKDDWKDTGLPLEGARA